MATSNTITIGRANQAIRRSFGRKTLIVRSSDVIASTAKALWANNVAAELAARAGVSVRTAENYLAGRGMHGNPLMRLLQSDAGPTFLAAIIAALPASKQKQWHSEFDRAAERAALLRRLDELEGVGLTD